MGVGDVPAMAIARQAGGSGCRSRGKGRAMSGLDAIGNTPMVELKQLNGKGSVRVLAKLEGNNPGGSIKDRPALEMVRKAEESGELTKDKTILEPTSGNTGIALAMIGAAKGYKVKLTLPECVSTERRNVLEAFGAEVVLTPAREATDGAIRKAHQLVEQEPGTYYMPNQFANENNILAHYHSTGPEIYEQTDGEVDVFITGMGTTGTLMGVARYLKEKDPQIRVVGVEPTEGHTIQGLKNMNEAIVPDIYDRNTLDDVVIMPDGPAFEMVRNLATVEGIFGGLSAGAAVAGALQIAADMKSGTVVTIIPDRGDRYLSTMFFRSVCAKCPP